MTKKQSSKEIFYYPCAPPRRRKKCLDILKSFSSLVSRFFIVKAVLRLFHFWERHQRRHRQRQRQSVNQKENIRNKNFDKIVGVLLHSPLSRSIVRLPLFRLNSSNKKLHDLLRPKMSLIWRKRNQSIRKIWRFFWLHFCHKNMVTKNITCGPVGGAVSVVKFFLQFGRHQFDSTRESLVYRKLYLTR